MYIKVFGHGKSRGEKAVRYLIRADYANRRETPPKILCSDPELTSELINSLPFAWKYTSGVLSWHPDDIVTAETEQKLMDDFEKLVTRGYYFIDKTNLMRDLLDMKGSVPQELRQRILAETNEDTLHQWLRAASISRSADEFCNNL